MSKKKIYLSRTPVMRFIFCAPHWLAKKTWGISYFLPAMFLDPTNMAGLEWVGWLLISWCLLLPALMLLGSITGDYEVVEI